MSTSRSDGGAAFPSEVASRMPADHREGMTLRDYFLAHAGDPPLSYMQRVCNIEDPGTVGALEYCEKVAEWRGIMADAMLAERAKKEARRMVKVKAKSVTGDGKGGA